MSNGAGEGVFLSHLVSMPSSLRKSPTAPTYSGLLALGRRSG